MLIKDKDFRKAIPADIVIGNTFYYDDDNEFEGSVSVTVEKILNDTSFEANDGCVYSIEDGYVLVTEEDMKEDIPQDNKALPQFYSDIKIKASIFHNTLMFRLKLLFYAFINVFTGKHLTLRNNIHMSVGDQGTCIEYWLKITGDVKWKHHAVSYDNINPPIGYQNGAVIESKKDC